MEYNDESSGFDNKFEEMIVVVVRRRSMGKHLMFLQGKQLLNADDADDDDLSRSVKIIFRRNSPSWNSSRDHTFPTKNSMIPNGSVLKLTAAAVLINQDHNDDTTTTSTTQQEKAGNVYEVHQWKFLFDPHEEALKIAGVSTENHHGDSEGKQKPSEGVSQHLYLKSRGNNFLKYNINRKHPKQEKEKVNKLETRNDNNVRNDEEDGDDHGSKKYKALRAKIFASFLIQKFGDKFFQQRLDNDDTTAQVLDVAGGKGLLSLAISLQIAVQCTVIDPLIRGKSIDGRQHFKAKDIKNIEKANGIMPFHIAKYFRLNEECLNLCKRSRLIVGLHPDECTEDILDAAIQTNTPAAIVPCCVFPYLFPHRKLANGKKVCTYHEFLSYLKEKDPTRIEQIALPFEGKNQLLLFDPMQYE